MFWLLEGTVEVVTASIVGEAATELVNGKAEADEAARGSCRPVELGVTLVDVDNACSTTHCQRYSANTKGRFFVLSIVSYVC